MNACSSRYAAPSEGDAVARGVGLVSMRERAELMGGTFAIRPATPRGVIVDVEVPLGLRAPGN